MKAAAVYTVLSLLNLIGFAVGVSFLPAEVPIHFNASMTADAVGSPWVYLAIPGISALISAGLWASLVQKKNRAITMGLLTAVGVVFATIGWTFFALVSSGVRVGEQTNFPLVLVTILPLSLLIAWLGNYMPRIEPNRVIGIRTNATLKSEAVWHRTHRLGGYLFFAAGVLSAVASVVFGTVSALKGLQYVSVALLVVSVLIAAVASVVYAQVLWKKSPPEEAAEGEAEA